jgi:hypothetical protein
MASDDLIYYALRKAFNFQHNLREMDSVAREVSTVFVSKPVVPAMSSAFYRICYIVKYIDFATRTSGFRNLLLLRNNILH